METINELIRRAAPYTEQEVNRFTYETARNRTWNMLGILREWMEDHFYWFIVALVVVTAITTLCCDKHWVGPLVMTASLAILLFVTEKYGKMGADWFLPSSEQVFPLTGKKWEAVIQICPVKHKCKEALLELRDLNPRSRLELQTMRKRADDFRPSAGVLWLVVPNPDGPDIRRGVALWSKDP